MPRSPSASLSGAASRRCNSSEFRRASLSPRPATPFGNTTTGANGEIVLQVPTLDLEHGPSFDVHAEFMPANERFHVDVLLDKQILEKETPPSLVTQAKLIQDYHWSPGATINEDRGRPVYRTTITALNGDRTVRPNERITLYTASGSTEIEVGGAKYSVTKENGHDFHADAEGELTFVIQADDLKPATISIWAGFMNPEARVTINPADEAHDRLSRVRGYDMQNDHVKKTLAPEKVVKDPSNPTRPIRFARRKGAPVGQRPSGTRSPDRRHRAPRHGRGRGSAPPAPSPG